MSLSLEHVLERGVCITARRETVFRFVTETPLWAAWWGPGSSIEARPGGAIRIQFPGNVIVTGAVLELQAERRIVFSYGYEDPGKPIPPAGSRVTLRLDDDDAGTRVTVRHELHDPAVRDHHVQGWRHQLALLANAACAEQHARASEIADRWFAAWAEPDAEKRRAEVAALAVEDVTVRDAHACLVGHDEVAAHMGAAQHYMPGVRLRREGDVRQCQGTALVDWVALGPDGAERSRGANVVDFAPDGRIARVVGLTG